MPDINFALLDAAIEDAANGAGGAVHDQAVWVGTVEGTEHNTHCGTAMCLAGFVAVREGVSPPAPKWSSYNDGWYFPDWTIDPETLEWAQLTGYHVQDFATERLGIGKDLAAVLFSSDNTIDDLRAMRDFLREHPDAGWRDLRSARVTEPEDLWESDDDD